MCVCVCVCVCVRVRVSAGGGGGGGNCVGSLAFEGSGEFPGTGLGLPPPELHPPALRGEDALRGLLAPCRHERRAVELYLHAAHAAEAFQVAHKAAQRRSFVGDGLVKGQPLLLDGRRQHHQRPNLVDPFAVRREVPGLREIEG